VRPHDTGFAVSIRRQQKVSHLMGDNMAENNANASLTAHAFHEIAKASNTVVEDVGTREPASGNGSEAHDVRCGRVRKDVGFNHDQIIAVCRPLRRFEGWVAAVTASNVDPGDFDSGTPHDAVRDVSSGEEHSRFNSCVVAHYDSNAHGLLVLDAFRHSRKSQTRKIHHKYQTRPQDRLLDGPRCQASSRKTETGRKSRHTR